MNTQLNSGGSPSIVSENSLQHNRGISIDWTSEEQSILEHLIKRYASDVSIDRYAKIAQALPNKQIRDVAMRDMWLKEKEKGKGKSVDISGTEILSCNSIAGDDTERLLEYNAKVLDQIQANFLHKKAHKNIGLLNHARANIAAILNELPDPFHNGMPPFPFKINEKLADAVLPPASRSKF